MGKSAKKIQWFYSYDWAVVAYLLSAVVLSRLFDFRIQFGSLLKSVYDVQMLGMIAASLLCFIVIVAIVKVIRHEDKKIFGSAWLHSMKNEFFTGQNIYDLIRVLVLLKLVLLVYCTIKQAIPRINPVIADDLLLLLDRALHFGINPITMLTPLYENEYSAKMIDSLYVAWYAVKAPVLVLFILIPDRDLSKRFFGAYFLLWMVGGLCALLIPSLGPVYVHKEWFLTIDTPIAESIQKQLMTHYVQVLNNPDNYKVFVYEGIAAFPSLHVGIVALYAFFLFRVNKFLGALSVFYLIMVQIGSVVLGWHYAVDGYFAIALAYILFAVFVGSKGAGAARTVLKKELPVSETAMAEPIKTSTSADACRSDALSPGNSHDVPCR